MVKESVSSIKKRRKNTSTNEGDSETDVYKKVLNFEEKESIHRKADEDAQIYFNTCQSIKDLLSDICKLKLEKKENNTIIRLKCMEACVKISALKKLNRLEKYRTIVTREALNSEKQKVDSTNLQYQNLLYESAHLLSEFTKCKQFKSKDEDIELITPEKFLEEASESVTKSFKDIHNLPDNLKHELHLARLEYELEQRKKLSELCNTFEDEKKQLAADIIEKKNRLDGLAPRLAAVLEATKPLQEHLGLPIDKIQTEYKLATLLPDSLYLLYANTDAFKQVYNINMLVEIVGDQEEAIQWKELQDTLLIADLDSDQEEQAEEIVETKKRRHRKSSHIDLLEEKKKKLVESHPLSVLITIELNEGPTLKMRFYYRPNLRIITVISSVDVPSKITCATAKEVLTGESIMNELLKQDFGVTSPNPSNQFQLQKVGLGTYQSLVSKLGYAYIWAQRVCGLEFLTEDVKKCDNKLSQSNIELIIKTIYTRLKHRFALSEQLQYLEQNMFPSLPNSVDCPNNNISSLTKWSSSNYQAFCHNSSADYLIENDIVDIGDLFYNATITRQKATLHAYIVIKNDYPKTAPIFSLRMKYNKTDSDSRNSDEIRDMEKSVNIGWENAKHSAGWLLTAQVRYLCAYFDVYLETLAPDTFPQNMVFFRNVSGRNRRRPFNFRKIGTGIFT